MLNKIDLSEYKTFIFDCDGVILNSNHIKTDAFFEIACNYGRESAEKLKEYHIDNAGISRANKFKYLFKEILNKTISESDINVLQKIFAKKILEDLQKCEIDHELYNLRKSYPNSNWAVISGGDQSELRNVFSMRGIDSLFNMGIFGSPLNKEDIISAENFDQRENYPVLFLGDSKYDFDVSLKFQMDFVFVSHWSNLPNWQSFVKNHKLNHINSIGDLVCSHDF